MSQNTDILAYLKTGASLTAIDALSLFGCFRLSARIKDLREMGNNINSVRVEENGKNFARYSLIGNSTRH